MFNVRNIQTVMYKSKYSFWIYSQIKVINTCIYAFHRLKINIHIIIFNQFYKLFELIQILVLYPWGIFHIRSPPPIHTHKITLKGFICDTLIGYNDIQPLLYNVFTLSPKTSRGVNNLIHVKIY